MNTSCCECGVLSGRGLCDGPIPIAEKSYWVCVWVSVSVMRCNINPTHLKWVGRRSQLRKKE